MSGDKNKKRKRKINRRLAKADKPIYTYSFPFSSSDYEGTLTVNEIHAIKYSLVSIIFALFATVSPTTSLSLATSMVLITSGIKRLKDHKNSLYIATIKYEPHYFLLPFIFTYSFLFILIYYIL